MSATTDRDVVAAFDFDETLTTGDSVIPFLRRFVHPARFVAGAARRPTRAVNSVVRRDRDRLREMATRIVFTGRPHDDVTTVACVHADHLIGHMLRPDTTARLQWHVAEGHRVVIVSASYSENK